VEAVGEIAIEFPVNNPGFHVYVVAPDPLSVAVEPLQITVEELIAVTEGVVFMPIVIDAVEIQPTEEPETEYIVGLVGETVILAAGGPAVQVYEVAPLAVNVLVLPIHTTLGLATIVIVGLGRTFNVVIALAVHPAAFEPVTV
jgi:hypothetical protein